MYVFIYTYITYMYINILIYLFINIYSTEKEKQIEEEYKKIMQRFHEERKEMEGIYTSLFLLYKHINQ